MTATSRMVFAFARDGGFPGSKSLAHVHEYYAVPLNALYLTAAATALFGIVFLISDSVFNAIGSASVVALGLSYALPIAIHCMRGRGKLPARPFMIPEKMAWSVNVVGIVYALVTAVLFLLPPKLPVTTATMNYGFVALALVMCLCWLTWIYHGKENYKGPSFAGLAADYQPISDHGD
jgi:choline transport protein